MKFNEYDCIVLERLEIYVLKMRKNYKFARGILNGFWVELDQEKYSGFKQHFHMRLVLTPDGADHYRD